MSKNCVASISEYFGCMGMFYECPFCELSFGSEQGARYCNCMTIENKLKEKMNESNKGEG